MFSISDIKQEAYPAAYRRGKELYERGLVQEFSYDVYTEDGVPKAELIGRVKGTVEDHYDVRLVIDEEYAEVSESRCNCEAFCNYEGICKHCVAVALAYVNRRQAKDILNAKLGVSQKTEQKDIRKRVKNGYFIKKSVKPLFHARRFHLSFTGKYLRQGGVRALFQDGIQLCHGGI